MTEIEYVKYCPLCGGENPRRQAFCRHCHDGDLTTVPVEQKRRPPSAPPANTADGDVALQSWYAEALARCTLQLVEDASVRFDIREGQSVGRTTDADVVLAGVPNQEWISGVHARFFRRGAQWYVQHLGDTNYIKVDGNIFRGHEEVPVQDGAIVILSLTPFQFRVTS